MAIDESVFPSNWSHLPHILPGLTHTKFLWWGHTHEEDPRYQRLLALNPWLDECSGSVSRTQVVMFIPRGRELRGLDELGMDLAPFSLTLAGTKSNYLARLVLLSVVATLCYWVFSR